MRMRHHLAEAGAFSADLAHGSHGAHSSFIKLQYVLGANDRVAGGTDNLTRIPGVAQIAKTWSPRERNRRRSRLG
ncbi:hypothetical protein MCHIJ_45740 [Mycolicibacterium chitae]|nr:hypothetical protein MCHIJ_45740 [Mycolicibacterium chitae]